MEKEITKRWNFVWEASGWKVGCDCVFMRMRYSRPGQSVPFVSLHYCTLHTAHCTLYTAHRMLSTLNTAYCPLGIAQSILRTLQVHTVNIAQCTLQNCRLGQSVPFVSNHHWVYAAHCTAFCVAYSAAYWTVHWTAHCIVRVAHCTADIYRAPNFAQFFFWSHTITFLHKSIHSLSIYQIRKTETKLLLQNIFYQFRRITCISPKSKPRTSICRCFS